MGCDDAGFVSHDAVVVACGTGVRLASCASIALLPRSDFDQVFDFLAVLGVQHAVPCDQLSSRILCAKLKRPSLLCFDVMLGDRLASVSLLVPPA